MQKASEKGPASPPSGQQKFTSASLRLWSYLGAALLLLLASLVAFSQSPQPNPLKQIEPFSLEWWRYPLELNAHKRLPVIDADLNDIFVLPDTELIWVVGSGGLILHSDDGGTSWKRQSLTGSQPAAKAASIELISSAHAAEAPLSKEQYLMEQKQQIAPPTDLRILTEQKTIPVKPDFPPISPIPADPATTALHAIHFINNNQGWAVGDRGLILRSDDGGNSWQQQETLVSSSLIRVQFTGTKGWITGADGSLLTSSDKGDSWQELRKIQGGSIYASYFVDAENGWAVDQNGYIQKGYNGGIDWVRSSNLSNLSPRNLYFINAETGWVIGLLGQAMRTTDGGDNWQRIDTGSDQTLQAVQFLDPDHGWAIGGRGAVLKSSDGGLSWRETRLPTNHQLNSLGFFDPERGWVAGNSGMLFATSDGGRNWIPLSRPANSDESADYARFPAPWYYLSWLLAGLLLIPVFQQPKQLIVEQQSVADMLVSDKPLEAGEPDALNFGLVARSLSRYLRNDNTQPPLTIAITGEWGTGKSSLMNLLKADLKHYGVRPVWFNAWHHQKESNLLASLLDNIRHQAVPDWWCFSGLNFRLRLLMVRGWRNCMPVLVVLFVFAVSAGIVCNPKFHLVDADNFSFTLSGMTTVLREKFPFLTLSASSIAMFIAAFKGFVAFGLDPKKLIPTIPGRLRIKNLNVELSFRQKFAREFKDVTTALQPRTMLILIDDLDRCQAEHVLEILETINYLVSSGKCYVVLGMARERVERCIGAAFKEIAEDMIDDTESDKVKDNGRAKRVEFARQYLEKLINIEVPVPVATPGQSRLLLAPKRTEISETVLSQQLLEIAKSAATKLFPWLLVLLVMWGGFQLGKVYHPLAEEKTASSQQTIPAGPSTPAAVTNPGTIDESVQDQPPAEKQGRAGYTPGQTGKAPKWLTIFPLLALLAAGILLLLKRPSYRVQDSPEFLQALTVWHPLIAAKRNTPRSIKRFLNRVRYFAMINRDQEDEKQKHAAQKQATPAPTTHPRLEEATLVALGALHHVDPHIIKNPQLFQQLSSQSSFQDEQLKNAKSAQRLKGEIQRALKEHEKVFGSWNCDEEQRALFLEISQGIQII
ncbi:Uncharacterized protein SAMN02745165_03356 [Malonomonas rubra DSM 5091]|uniref:Photosynthesis system II assembly factor Ycf48/Hcf136-like domain-containing protein n=1 Tax=Malonomonas rubra DSM 5091 TaxID=1122189 RepID=A0A1M6MQ29_MALRU|nr:YCF48-related protein [Malonomonas rubra]SHJ85516.1 Uncharacterized protein SAMN02745165_03356 [Malonomonas rubra DSM 5091]